MKILANLKENQRLFSWTWCKRWQQKQPHCRADEGSFCAWKFVVYEAVWCLVIWIRLNLVWIIWLVPEFYILGVEQEIFFASLEVQCCPLWMKHNLLRVNELDSSDSKKIILNRKGNCSSSFTVIFFYWLYIW